MNKENIYFGCYNFLPTNTDDYLVCKEKKIVYIRNTFFQNVQIDENFIIFSFLNTKLIFIYFNSYQELYRRYKRLFKKIDIKDIINYFIIVHENLNENDLIKFRKLLKKNIKHYEEKEYLLDPLISYSKNNIGGYIDNIESNSDEYLRNRFSVYEIPVEMNKIKLIDNIKSETSDNKNKFLNFLNNYSVL